MWSGALSTEPASNGGCGSYSMPSWIACAKSSPAMRAASVRRHVDARRHAGRGDDLALLDDAPRRSGSRRTRVSTSSDAQCVVASLPFEQSGRGEQHRAGAHRRRPRAARVDRADPVERLLRPARAARVANAAGHDEDVGARHLVDRVVGDEREDVVVGADLARSAWRRTSRPRPGRRCSTSYGPTMSSAVMPSNRKQAMSI